jgi:hypothetical protein
MKGLRVFSLSGYQAPVHPCEKTRLKNTPQFDFTGVLALIPSIEPARESPPVTALFAIACPVIGNYYSYGLIFALRRTPP